MGKNKNLNIQQKIITKNLTSTLLYELYELHESMIVKWRDKSNKLPSTRESSHINICFATKKWCGVVCIARPSILYL